MTRSFARISAVGSFSQIAWDFFEEYKKAKGEVDRRKAGLGGLRGDDLAEAQYDLGPAEREAAKYAVSVIIFSAMAAEAYIYDYAARLLSDDYVQDYIDKLDLVSKWVIVPRLVTGQQPDVDGRAIQLLRQLVKQRNRLIHNKSVDLAPHLPNPEKIMKKVNVELKPTLALEAIILLAKEIERLDPEEPATHFLGVTKHTDDFDQAT